jgi:hypothetical protein
MKRIIKSLLKKINLEISIKKLNNKNIVSSHSMQNHDELNSIRQNLFDEFLPYFTLDDLTMEELNKINDVKPYTMTGPLRMASLVRSVEHIVKNKIPGAFVECGVWKGGSMMLVAKTLIELEEVDRDLYLYDTFEGMANPTSQDFSYDKKLASDLLNKDLDKKQDGNNIWCYSNLEEVRANLLSLGYNNEKIHFIKGKVEETIPSILPEKIALLRLDTDWYESTVHELEHLFPLLVKRGILIIDDYGQWMGQKKAVDEYITKHHLDIFLNRIDFSSRLAIKF